MFLPRHSHVQEAPYVPHSDLPGQARPRRQPDRRPQEARFACHRCQRATPVPRRRRPRALRGPPLDTQNQIIGIHTVTIGTLAASLVHPREVFKPAILANAASVLLAHNHPSGYPTPSAEDRAVTRQLTAAGGHIGIEVTS
jgi:hypothetical protein